MPLISLELLMCRISPSQINDEWFTIYATLIHLIIRYWAAGDGYSL